MIDSASFLWVMAGVFEYNTQMPCAPEALQGYRATSSLLVGLLFVICTLLLLSYKLNTKTAIEMAQSLANRRKKAAA